MTFRLIKNTRLLYRQAGLILLLLCLSWQLMAQVNVSVSDTTGVNGQEAIVYVRANHALGASVYSFQLKLLVDATALQLLQVSKGTSLPANWAVPVVNQTGNVISIASYGTVGITAGDELLRLRFGLISNVAAVVPLTLQQFYFDEGLPTATLQSGSVNCENRIPYLDSVAPIAGSEYDELSFDLVGHDPQGLDFSITALNPPAGAVLQVVDGTTSRLVWTPGFTQAGQYILNYRIQNTQNYGDTLSVNVTVTDRVAVSIPFTTCQPLAYANVPVYGQDFTGQQVYSIFSRIQYDPTKLVYNSIVQTGSLTSGWSAPAVTCVNGLLTVSFYGTTPLTGSGNIFYIRLSAIGELHTNAPLHFQTFILNEGNPASETMDGNVFIGGPEPWIDPVAAIVVSETALVEFVITAHDPQILPLTLTAVNLPAGAVLQSTGYGTASFSWQTDYFDFGTYQPKFYARNSNLLADSLTVQISINNVPQPPFVQNPVSSISFAEDTVHSSLNLNNVFNDSDIQAGDALSFSYSGNTHIGVSIVNGSVTLTPQADWNGQETLTFTATDLATNAVAQSIVVTVTAVNDAPRLLLAVPDVTMQEDSAGSSIDMLLYFSESDGDNLTYQIAGNTHVNVTFDQHTMQLTPVADWFGSEQLTVRATESGTVDGYYTEEVFSVTVQPVNDSPYLVTAMPYVTMNYNTVYTSGALSLYFGDIDSPLQYTFGGYSHIQVALNGSQQIVITPEHNWYGVDYLTITATDDYLQAVQQTIRVSAIRDFVITEDYNHSGALPTGWQRSPSTGTNIWAPKIDLVPDYSMEVANPISGSIQRLTTSAYNMSLYKNVQTSFYYNLSGTTISALFQYSLNGLNYYTIGTLVGGGSGIATYAVPAAQQQSAVRFRWTYQSNSGLPNYWNIDDFQITGEYGDFTKPTTIADLAITGSTVTQATLHWTPCTEQYFDRYEIVYSLNSTIDGQDPIWGFANDPALRFLSTNQTTVTCLQRDTQYWFAVRGVDTSANVGVNSNSVNVLLNQKPVFSTPLPQQPPAQYSGSRTTMIGITTLDDVLVNAATLQYRIDSNGNGSYDLAEAWTSIPGYTNSDLLNVTVNGVYQVDGERLAFEFRVMDAIGLGYVYSGSSATEGIADDYYVRIDTQSPSVISDLRTSATTATSVTLAWSQVTELHFGGYEVYYGSEPGITTGSTLWSAVQAANLNNIATTQTVVTDLTEGQRYWFRILARDAAGNACQLSNEVTNVANSVLPLFSSPLPLQSGIYHSSRTVTIGATVYDAYGTDQTRIEYRFDRNGNGVYDASESWQQVSSILPGRLDESLVVSATAAFDVDGEHLRFEFRTWDINGYGPAHSGTSATAGSSDDWFVMIDTSFPAAIQTLVTGVTTSSSVQLAWSASSDNHFRRYEIYYGNHADITGADSLWTDSNDAILGVAGTGLITTTLQPLAASTRYYFRVRAVDHAGNGTWSTEVNAITIGLYAPAVPAAMWMEISGEDVILHWNPVSTDTHGNPLAITGYNIYASTAPDFEANIGTFIDIVTATEYTFYGIASSIPAVFFKVTSVYEP